MRKVINDTIKLRNQFYSDFDLIYVLGDMRELGEYSEKQHRELMAQVAQSADEVFIVGHEM
jgi:UDP-N-acetylmuramyl pentapeptide synthase